MTDDQKKIAALTAERDRLKEIIRDFLSCEYQSIDCICQKRLIKKCMCRECIETRATETLKGGEVNP